MIPSSAPRTLDVQAVRADFPILSQSVNGKPLAFLDSAASSQKPLAVIEAMMAGLPVVATRVGGVGEVVEDGGTGLLVPPGEPEALAAALRRLVEHEDLRRQMGAAGRERALRLFTADRMVGETRALYAALLAARKRG